MSAVRFKGRVFPPSLHITLPYKCGVVAKDDDLHYEMRLAIAINDSIIAVDCEIDEYSEDKVPRLLLRAIDSTQAIVDVIAFSNGGPANVSFETVVLPDGAEKPLVIYDPDLAVLCTAFSKNGPELRQIIQLVMHERNLHHALRDLIESTSGAHKVVPHCAKAIETLRNLLALGEADPKKAWKIMRDALKVNETYLKTITDESKAPRHGDHKAIPGEVTDKIAQRSWTIMNRFLELRKRKVEQLPIDEFPLLAG